MHAASALIPANDDEDEELVSKAKANRSKKLVEEKGTEQGFANTAGYGGATVTTVERGVKKLAKSGSELEAGNLTAVAALAKYVQVAPASCWQYILWCVCGHNKVATLYILTCYSALCCSGSWVSEFQRAAEVVSTSPGAKSYVSEACNSIGKLGTSARQGDEAAAKKAFVSAVSSLQSWATDAKISVRGL